MDWIYDRMEGKQKQWTTAFSDKIIYFKHGAWSLSISVKHVWGVGRAYLI